MLITPNERGDLKSLYRSFRTAMEWVKGAPIVAIFLGTKSSLQDFVLNPKRDPSQRKEIIDPNRIIIHGSSCLHFHPFNRCKFGG